MGGKKSMQCGFPDELRLVCSDIRSVNATDMYCGQGRRILAATSRSRRTVCATCKSEARIDGWPSPGRCASPLASGHQARTVPPRGPFPATHLHRTHLHRTWGCVAGRGFAARTGCRCAICLHCAAHRPDPALAVCLHCAAHRPDPALAVWAGVSFGRHTWAGVSFGRHTWPGASFGSHTWAGVALQDP